MKKGKSITLLSILGVIMAVLIVLTFVKFPIGDVKIFNSFVGAYEKDYDLAGGYAYTLALSDENDEEIEDKSAFLNVLSDRVANLGYETYSVKGLENSDNAVDDYKVRIELKSGASASGDVAAIAAYGKVRVFGGTDSSNLSEILADINAIDSAKYLGSSYHNDTTYQSFSVTFTGEAKAVLDPLISGASSYYIKFILGEEEGDFSTTVLDTAASSFSITSAYSNGTLSLSYGNDAAQVKRMVMLLNNGGIDYKFKIESGVEITSLFGNVSVPLIVSIVTVLMAAVVFFTIKGKGYGIIACLTILFVMPIYLFMFVAIPGIVVNTGTLLGMFATAILLADGLIFTYKRIDEEYASGKTVKASLKAGFKRSIMPALSVGVISVSVSVAALFFTKGIIKGFAIAFGIGTAASLIATLLFVRMFTALVLPLVHSEKRDKFLNLKREEE